MWGHVTEAAESLDVTSLLSAQVQNEQCQEMVQSDDQKWIKVTNNGEWGTHTVSASRGQCFPLPGLGGSPHLSLCLSLLPGESEVGDEHPVLEDHWHPGGGQKGQACAAQKHPDRR